MLSPDPAEPTLGVADIEIIVDVIVVELLVVETSAGPMINDPEPDPDPVPTPVPERDPVDERWRTSDEMTTTDFIKSLMPTPNLLRRVFDSDSDGPEWVYRGAEPC